MVVRSATAGGRTDRRTGMIDEMKQLDYISELEKEVIEANKKLENCLRRYRRLKNNKEKSDD